MKDVIVHPGPQVEIIDSPIPHPGADQLVIKVVVSGSNPKDWYGYPTKSVCRLEKKPEANTTKESPGVVENKCELRRRYCWHRSFCW